MMNINNINTRYDNTVPIISGLYRVTDYPVIHGYNVVTSYRSGGKTTNQLLWALNAWYDSGITTCYFRISKQEITERNINTMYNTIKTYTGDDGLNYVQRITNCEYDTIYYIRTKKQFVVGKETDSVDDIKKRPVICYVMSCDEWENYKSGFADNNANIIIFDEIVSKKANGQSLLNFCNCISTIFRTRPLSTIFINCNLSAGNPVILQQMEIYEKMLVQETSHALYKTKKGTQISCVILGDVEKSLDNERCIFNQQYMGFNLDGIENITGVSVIHNPYRELPADVSLSDCNIYINSCGQWLHVYYTSSEVYQSMYYVKKCKEPNHTANTISITDDKLLSYRTPYTYYGIGRDFPALVKLAKHYRRGDVCVDSMLTDVYLNSFYDFHRIPDNI